MKILNGFFRAAIFFLTFFLVLKFYELPNFQEEMTTSTEYYYVIKNLSGVRFFMTKRDTISDVIKFKSKKYRLLRKLHSDSMFCLEILSPNRAKCIQNCHRNKVIDSIKGQFWNTDTVDIRYYYVPVVELICD